MKSTLTLFLTFVVITLSTYSNADDKKDNPSAVTEISVEDTKCQAPQWAIAIGHEHMWKLHNGCGEKKDPDVKK